MIVSDTKDAGLNCLFWWTNFTGYMYNGTILSNSFWWFFGFLVFFCILQCIVSAWVTSGFLYVCLILCCNRRMLHYRNLHYKKQEEQTTMTVAWVYQWYLGNATPRSLYKDGLMIDVFAESFAWITNRHVYTLIWRITK